MSGRDANARLRIFFASDIHASTLCFKKFLNAGKHYRADILIVGGDVTGKSLVPLVEDVRGIHRGYYMGEETELRSEAEIARYEAWVDGLGSYTLRCTPAEHAALTEDNSLREIRFREAMEARVARWMELADERLDGQPVQAFFNAGNDDIFSIDSIIDRSKRLVRPEGRVVEVGDSLTMISCGFANLTPFGCPRDVSEEVLQRRIAAMASQVPDLSMCIFNLHCPPHGTALDQAPVLDEDLKPRRSGLGVAMGPAGSTSVREAIERFQPLLGLHGHIHESKGLARLGRTLCFNPGSEYHEGILRGVLVDIRGGRVDNYQFTSG
jgi:Icc-related predicted phosphoesterase